MASSTTEEISLKELTPKVVQDELTQINAFKILLNTYLESNILTEKRPLNEVFNSVTELLSIVTVLRDYFDRFSEEFGVHLVGYTTTEKLEKVYVECLTFRKLLRLKKDEVTDVRPRSPIDASSVADFVVDKSTPSKQSLKCSSCKKPYSPSPKDNKSQLTCRTVDVNKRYRPKKN